VFEFDVGQFLATVSVLVDVVLLGLVTMALSVGSPAVSRVESPQLAGRAGEPPDR
jgi:hypothetical protein